MENLLKRIWKIFRDMVYLIIRKIFPQSISDKKIESMLQFVKFGIVGVSNTVVHYVIYLICTLLGIHYIVSNFCAFTISVLNSFYWNNRYVFKEDGQRSWIRVLIKTYISYGITGLILNSALLYIEVDICKMNEFLAPIFNLIITIPLNFIINKFWAYKEK